MRPSGPPRWNANRIAAAMKPEIATFRIDEMLRQLEVEFAPLARENGLALAFVPCSLAVRSDRRLLRRLLQNLVSNAIKYTPSGRVLVGCRRRGERLRIDVYDTGVGVPPSQRRTIFREFQRLDHAGEADVRQARQHARMIAAHHARTHDTDAKRRGCPARSGPL